MAVRPLPPWFSARQPSAGPRTRVGGPTKPKFYGAPAPGNATADTGPKYSVTPGASAHVLEVPPGATGADDPVYLIVHNATGISYEDYLRAKRDAAIPEKFRDPRGLDPDCSDPSGGAYGYLYTTPTSADEMVISLRSLRAITRVRRMRQKVDDFGSDHAHTLPSVGPMWQASHVALLQNVGAIIYGYQAALDGSSTKKQIQDFADKIGSSPMEVIAKGPSILASFGAQASDASGQAQDALKDAASEAAKMVWRAVGPQVMNVFKSLADEFAAIRTTAGSAASAAEGIPAIGAFLGAAVSLIGAAESQADATYLEGCTSFMNDAISAPLNKLIREGYPYPWHVLDQSFTCDQREGYTSSSKYVQSTSLERAAHALRVSASRLEGIDPIASPSASGAWLIVTPMRRWWALAAQLMAYGDVAAIFAALGDDAGGGTVASDEQVLLVAAPIAASRGLPIWDFAQALYDTSLGWRDPSVAALLKPEPYNVCALDATTAPEGGCLRCKTAPANAGTIQWGVLARDAFALADKAARGEVPGVTPIGFADGSVPTVPPGGSPVHIPESTPIVFGAIGSGLLYAAGASVPIVAIPVIVGGVLAGISRWANARARARALDAGESVGRVASMGCKRCGLDRGGDRDGARSTDSAEVPWQASAKQRMAGNL